MATVWRVVVLKCGHVLARYAMYVMMEYLTDVWGISFIDAASIVNVFWGLIALSQLFLGLGLLTMSTPPVLAKSMGTCSEYKPQCIGRGQEILFYTAMPFIAFGMCGHLTSFEPFLHEQEEWDEFKNNFRRRFCFYYLPIAIVTIVAVTALPYIKPRSLQFGIPAIFTLVALILFLSGSGSYKYFRPQGSPMTMIVRVFFAATSKLFYKSPADSKELYETKNPQIHTVSHTRSLRCLDKAAIIIPTQPREEQEKNTWRLCRVTEVEETKTIIRMIPVWMTFILCGVVSAIGLTFFVEQLQHLNPKIGHLKVPIVVLLWFFGQAQNGSALLSELLSANFVKVLGQSWSRKFPPFTGIAISMILAILCCITAAEVENRRLGVVQKHGLIDKPDERVPMTMFWLLPQFVLLGFFEGIFRRGANSFFIDQSPVSTKKYLSFFMNGVAGAGILGSVLSVYVVGKVSERGGKMNWFQRNLNASRLDKYYWTLSWLMAINLIIHIGVAIFYRYREPELGEQEAPQLGGIQAPFNENSKCFSCCC